ncbi:hypothetical protein H5410_060757, partial [Solanum commersonii]
LQANLDLVELQGGCRTCFFSLQAYYLTENFFCNNNGDWQAKMEKLLPQISTYSYRIHLSNFWVSLMDDPMIVSSGHTFERNCVLACKSLCFTPILPDASLPSFSTIIPNRALKSTIINWCSSSHIHPPQPIDFISTQHFSLNRDVSTSSEESGDGPYPYPLYPFDSEQTRHDSALALFHLSMVQSNHAKLVKLGAVQSLLSMVRTGLKMGQILLILCNMEGSLEGR